MARQQSVIEICLEILSKRSQEQYLWRKAGSNRLSFTIASPYGGLMTSCKFHLNVFRGFGEGLVPFPQRVSVEDTGECCC